MVELNKTIQWKPASTGEGRFGNWLENMVDWNLSRSRFWGTPLPIWRTEDGEEEKCIGSIQDLLDEVEKARILFGNEINKGVNADSLDLHKPFVDGIVLASSLGKKMHRIPDLVDVWFDSVLCLMPNGTIHLKIKRNSKKLSRPILSLKE
jgi:isoleucyl-tRNA synthetase